MSKKSKKIKRSLENDVLSSKVCLRIVIIIIMIIIIITIIIIIIIIIQIVIINLI